jgi:glycosyltransferase involved in cell wall biosynthesis
MKILVAHNRYQFAGGEDAVVGDETALLREHGHSVELLEEDNDSIQGLRGALLAAASITYSAGSRNRIRQRIGEFKPEILHIHNWFPRLSPSIILEAAAQGVPVIQTLHNYRMVCANALLFRNGAICTDCLGRPLPIGGALHGCYRGSRAGSAVVTAAYAFHRLFHTWEKVDLFIAVSEFQRSLLLRGGMAAEKIVVKPNFVHDPGMEPRGEREDFALYAGRLFEEKGIRTLLAAWKTGKIPLRLRIYGDGPLAGEVISCAKENSLIEYRGRQPTETIYEEMARARFLVFPSESYETFGKTVIEAYSHGTPVLAADLGNLQELVEAGATGCRFQPGDADSLVTEALRFPRGDLYQQMSRRCRDTYAARYSAGSNYQALMEIYAHALELRRARG